MYLKEELYALIKSDERIFDFIQESSLDGLWYWDLENPENEWMNARFWTVLGYHPDEMPHKSSAWQSIINQDDLKVANENFVKHCADPNHPYDQTVRYTHRNGSTVWIRCRGMAIRDTDGKPIRMLGAHQDVTELKRGEQELVKAGEKILESEEKYRAFYNNAPLSYQSLDENGCFIDINPMWSKTLGYERDEVIGKWYGDFLHPDYVEHFRSNFPAFKKRGYVSDVQFKLRRKDNTCIYVSFEGCVGYTPEGKFKQTYCVFKDITEQKALENAIKKAKGKAEESEAKLSALFTSMSEMVVLHELVFDENEEPVNYRITDCNDAFTRITGITRENAIGRLSTEVYGTEHPPYLKEFSEVALTGEPSHYETYFHPMDKHFSISVISPEKNKFATVTTDITKIKQSELFLQNNNEEIAAQNEELAAQNLELNQANQKIIEAKEKAEESEKKYRLFTEFAADVVWVLNLTTEKFTYISPSIFQLRGFTVEEAMHERLQDTMTPESLRIVKDAIAKNTKYFIEHPEANNYYINEIQQTCKNGQIIWVEISTKFRYSPTGDIVVVGVSRNIDERKRAEEALRQEKVFQETLLDLTKGFLNTSLVDFDTVVEAMLGKAGEFSKVDRVYVFKHDHLRRVTSNSHEWCKEGITPEKENLQEIPFDFFSDMLDAWEKGEMVHIPSVSQMPEEHTMRAILINQGIQSLILIPLNQGEKNIGFIGFDVVDQCKSFTEQEIALLLVMAEIISNAFTRKRAEEELKKSKEMLSETESIGKVGGWSFNIDTMKQKWTDEVYRIHEVEISPEPGVEAGINYYTRESRPIIERAVQRAIEHGEDYDLELEITTAKGNTRAVHTIGKADLKNRRIHGFFQDITERKRAEERLIASEYFFSQVFEQSIVSTQLLSPEGDTLRVNKPFCELFGVTPEAMMQYKILEDDAIKESNAYEPLLDVFNNKKSRRWFNQFDIAHASESSGVKTTRPEKVHLENLSYPVLDNKGNLEYVVIQHQNITERKQAENELKESEEKFKTFFRSASDGILIADIESKMFIDCNNAISQMIGYTIEELKNLNVNDIHPKNDISDVINKFERQAKGEIKLAENLPVKRKDDSIFYADINSFPITIKGKQYLCGIFRDITERKRAEDAILELKNFNESIVTNLTEGIILENDDGIVQFANPAMANMLGYKEGELVSKHWTYFVPDDQVEVVKNANKRRKKGESDQYEMELIRKNGERIFVLVGGVPTLNIGANIGLLAAFTNITERKQAEEKLKLLNRAVEASSVSVVITDPEGHINYVNPCFTELTGYSHEEVLGENPRFLKSGNHPKEFYKDLWDTILSGREWTGEFQNKKKNGELYWEKAVISPIQNSNGEVANFVAIKEDITEHKRFEDTRKLLLEISQLATKHSTLTSFLAEVHQKLKKIIRSDNFYVALYNEADQTITLPYHVDEYDSLELNKAYDFRNSFTDRVLRTNQSLIVTPDYLLSPEKDGKSDEYGNQLSVWLGVPFKTTEGSKPNGVIAIQDYQNRESYTETDKSIMEIIAHSIGSFIERIKYIEELVHARKKAEESDRLKSAFLANMSHEIRTPMNGILGFADLLKNPNLTGEKLQKYISIIEKSGDRMLNIINDIVDISKIEAGLMTSDIKEAIINEQTEYVYTFFKPEAEAKGIKFSFKNTLPQKEAIIKTDREKLYAILTNLVKNAIKYTREGAIEFGYHLKKHNESVELEFYVKDTGIGIPKDRQEAIFERFIQADIADKMAYQGAGLGLAITKAYVEMLGGKIWVESEEGIGSTFYFTLPYSAKPVKETNDQQHEPLGKSEAVRKLKILIAEDDEVSEILIESYIKMLGNEILKAKTGIEAIEACRKNPDIDLILMDIRMPGMEGYEATKQIREFNKEVIIIAQTAYGLTGDREKSLESGCNDYIAKPIKKNELISLIKKYFGE